MRFNAHIRRPEQALSRHAQAGRRERPVVAYTERARRRRGRVAMSLRQASEAGSDDRNHNTMKSCRLVHAYLFIDRIDRNQWQTGMPKADLVDMICQVLSWSNSRNRLGIRPKTRKRAEKHDIDCQILPFRGRRERRIAGIPEENAVFTGVANATMDLRESANPADRPGVGIDTSNAVGEQLERREIVVQLVRLWRNPRQRGQKRPTPESGLSGVGVYPSVGCTRCRI